MADYGTQGPAYTPTAHEEEEVAESLREFSAMQWDKSTLAAHCEEVAELILPDQSNTFYPNNQIVQGAKKTDKQIDSNGAMALTRFAAICDSLLTPRNSTWHGLESPDPYVMKDRASRLWFEQVTRLLFQYRYAAIANFASQNQANFTSLGAFGNMTMFIDAFSGPQKGIRYKAIPFGETYYHENHQGIVDGFCRYFRMTARQIRQQWPDTFPAELQSALEKNSEQKFDILHRICPRSDYEEDRLDLKGKPYASYYVSLTGRRLLSEGGYSSFPMAVGRYTQSPNETYGRGPAMLVLPALKTLNAEKRVFLKAGHRAGDPVLLTADDGVVDFNMTPGWLNKGGMTSDGKPLIGTLPVGNIQITKEMMEDEKGLILDAFLVSLFQILLETPQMTATEVIERTNEKGILLAPTVGRQQSEYIGTMVPRELDVLAEQRLLPPMPPRLREAAGEYHVEHTSPLSRAMRAQEASGFIRSVEVTKEIVNITQDPSFLDVYDFDTATPAIAQIFGSPESWMADQGKIDAKRKLRAQQLARQQQIQAAPAAAALMKAQAAQQKAGGGGGGIPQAPAPQPTPGTFSQ